MRCVRVAAAALIDVDGQVLVAQRPEGKSLAGLWEFPGGKIETGETPEAALVRELHEELGISVTVDALTLLTVTKHDYPDFHLEMTVYACRVWAGTPHGQQGQPLLWARTDTICALPMPPADLPVIAALRSFVAAA